MAGKKTTVRRFFDNNWTELYTAITKCKVLWPRTMLLYSYGIGNPIPVIWLEQVPENVDFENKVVFPDWNRIGYNNHKMKGFMGS